METTYKTLAKFLASINLTEWRLKYLTGIPIYRLRAIYKEGAVTDDELIKLIKVLSAPRAVELAYASQIGNFNQNGIGNKQTIINNFVTIVMRRLGTISGVTQPRMLPVQPVHGGTAQLRILSRQPASQVAPIGGGLPPASHIF